MQKMILGGLMLAAMAAAGAARADNAPYCREYQQQVTIGGILRNTYGTACQQPDGSWQKIDNGTDQSNAADTVASDLETVQYQQPVQQVVYVQQPLVYQEPYYRPPVIYPSIGLSFGFNDWHGGGGRGWSGGHGDGWHGGGRWH